MRKAFRTLQALLALAQKLFRPNLLGYVLGCPYHANDCGLVVADRFSN